MKKTVSLRVIVILISLFMGLRIESASFVRRRSGASCQIDAKVGTCEVRRKSCAF